MLQFESALGSDEAQRERRSAWLHYSVQNAPLILAFVMLVAVALVYSVLYFGSLKKLPGDFEVTSTINNAMPLVMAGVGQSVVVVTRGLDLSVGGMIDLANSIAAVKMQDSPGSMIEWTVIILLIGAVGGLINGLLVGVGRLQPILVTLATLSIFQGLAIWVLPSPGGAIPPSYTQLLVNPNGPTALVWVVVLALFWLIFRRTSFGVDVYAIGNDEQAARANGVNVLRTTVGAYVLCGVFAACAGLFLAATTTAGDATTGNSFTLTSIAAVVLGGVSFFGGRGSAVGSILGALVLTILVNVLFFAHIDPLYQSFYQGLFLILAVVLSMLIGLYFKRNR